MYITVKTETRVVPSRKNVVLDWANSNKVAATNLQGVETRCRTFNPKFTILD